MSLERVSGLCVCTKPFVTFLAWLVLRGCWGGGGSISLALGSCWEIVSILALSVSVCVWEGEGGRVVGMRGYNNIILLC